MRGSQTPRNKIEEVKAIAVKANNIAEASRQTNVPYSTAHAIVTNDDEFDKFRCLAWKQYIFDTWGNIEKISGALGVYIGTGRLDKLQLRDFTGALKDLRATVENVLQSINNYNLVNNNSQSSYQLTEEDKTNWSIKYLEAAGYKVEKLA